jgi:16S rRNA G527 N7-methylase RsmG
MTSNITLKIDTDLLREAKVIAAEQGSSLSALVAGRLEELVRERKTFDLARKRALARLNDGLDLGFEPAASRDELYER